MGKDKLDKHIHSVFQNHEVPVDTNEIWAGVESSLPQKTTGYPLWFFLAAGLVIVASLGIYLMSGDVQGENERNEVSELSVASQDLSDGAVDQMAAKHSESAMDNQNIDVAEAKETQNTLATNEPEGSNEDRRSGTLGNEPSGQNTDLSDAERIDQSQDIALSSRPSETLMDDLKSAGTDTRRNETNTSFSASSNALSAERTESHGTRSGADHPLANDASTLNLERTGERTSIGVLSLLTREEATTELLSTNAISVSLPSLNDCYDFSLRSWLWTLDAYAGFNYAGKSLAWKTTSTSHEDYIRNRESTESYLEAFDAGISFSAIHRKGLLAGVGVNYSQINEKFNYFEVKTESRFDSVVIRIEIDSAGRADTIKDWRQVTVQTASEILTYNSYRMVDIPLFVGYQFYKGDWTFEFQGGVMVNLLMKKKGEILDPALNVVEVTDNDLVFKDRIGLSAFGSFKAIYPLTTRLGVYAEPHFRVNLKSITTDAYPLEQRYNQFGLHVGARWIF